MPGQQRLIGTARRGPIPLFAVRELGTTLGRDGTLNDVGDYERMAELAEQRVKSGGLPSAPWPD